MKKSWWKVPLYCLCASMVCWRLEIYVFARFTLVTLPDGSITSDSDRWLAMSGLLFAAVLLVGWLVFRNMTRRELFCSASVMVCVNAVFSLLAYRLQGMFSIRWAELSEWRSFVSQALYQLGLPIWPAEILDWATPYLFVLFGKKARDAQSEAPEAEESQPTLDP